MIKDGKILKRLAKICLMLLAKKAVRRCLQGKLLEAECQVTRRGRVRCADFCFKVVRV